MFLKTLQLKGFKSFADKTLLEFEPGVTVVIGPNGSGKSNVVDAVAWVLGAQGARALRGGKMDDVIFAGTTHRPALGRAEVSLTIDNASGMLPIEFSEVTITRRLFRTGDSEYEINGAPCRLLDIQELLSDTGIGRSQHVIVGQGQLDQVLNARPEDRRAIIEEAAGVLKFRKRKEKAERRLEATEGNLLRLSDLLREVRRQLRPLERQADAARRYDGLVAELRAARLYLVGREIDQLTSRTGRHQSRRVELARTDNDLRVRLRGLDTRVLDAEKALTVPGQGDVADLLLRVEQARERGRGMQALVAERLRGIDRELDAAADEGVVETLVADGALVRNELALVDADFASLAPTSTEVEAAELKMNTLRDEIEATANVSSDLSVEGRERKAGEDAVEACNTEFRSAEAAQAALRKTVDAMARDEPKLEAELISVTQQLEAVAPERAQLERAEQLGEVNRAELDAITSFSPEDTEEGRALRRAEDVFEYASEQRAVAYGALGRCQARAETLQLALDEAHTATGGDAIREIAGVIGPLVDQLVIDDGVEVAVASALGDALNAIVLVSPDAARSAVDHLKAGDGKALLVVLGAAQNASVPAPIPQGTTALAAMVRSTQPGLNAVLQRLLANVVLADSWQRALDIALGDPALIAVTREGDRFGGGSVWRAGPLGRSAVTPAALEEARDRVAQATATLEAADTELAAAREQLHSTKQVERQRLELLRTRRIDVDRALDAASKARRDFERRTAGLDERLILLQQRIGELREQHAGVPEQLALADARYIDAEQNLELARQRLAGARRAELVAGEQLRARRAELDRVRTAAAKLRRDFEVRGAAIEERRAVLTRRLDEIERRLAARPDEEAAAQRRRAVLTERQAAIGALSGRLVTTLAAADTLAESLREQRRLQSEAAREAAGVLDTLRVERADTERTLLETRELLSRLDVEEAENKLRLETAVESLRRDFDCEPALALAAPAPEVPENVTIAQRARDLDRELRLLGPVNPLALTEYEALVERHEFLQQQLDDVKNSRRDLNRVIQAVNAEIISVFDQAFSDVARHFEEMFALLFPGGSGRLFLTDPSDLLNTGVEVEARPSGKTPRRLSLLSGGERSLAALAYLFAVFRARPSPFYLLDEVEAALDDVNLHRFLDLVHEFRNEAQLVIVSHQKRTMESADVLYGVTMAPGSSSRVVSQRMKEIQLEEA